MSWILIEPGFETVSEAVLSTIGVVVVASGFGVEQAEITANIIMRSGILFMI